MSYIVAQIGRKCHLQERRSIKELTSERRIPVSEIGYRIHFAAIAAIEAKARPQDYVRLVALAFVRRMPVDTIRMTDPAPPTLFSPLDWRHGAAWVAPFR